MHRTVCELGTLKWVLLYALCDCMYILAQNYCMHFINCTKCTQNAQHRTGHHPLAPTCSGQMRSCVCSICGREPESDQKYRQVLMSRYTLHNVHICVCTSKRIYTCSNPIELGGVSKVNTKHIQSFSTSESASKLFVCTANVCLCVGVVNPQRACAARVTVVVLCVCE